MMQVAAWFVAGVALMVAFTASRVVGLLDSLAYCGATLTDRRKVWALWVALVLSSGVAVAATAVALGVGR